MVDVLTTRQGLTERDQQTGDATGVAASTEAELTVESPRQHELGNPQAVSAVAIQGRLAAWSRAERQGGVGSNCVVEGDETLQRSVDRRAAPLPECSDRRPTDGARLPIVEREVEQQLIRIIADDPEQIDESRPRCRSTPGRQGGDRRLHDRVTEYGRPTSQRPVSMHRVDTADDQQLHQRWERPLARLAIAEAPRRVPANQLFRVCQ